MGEQLFSSGRYQYTDEEIKDEIRRVSEEYCNGDSPRVSDMKKYAEISSATAISRFGSWNDALEESGLKANSRGRGNKISKDNIIQELKRISDEELNGQRPRQEDFDEGKYSVPTLKKRFGSWWKALDAAGFETDKWRQEQDNCISDEDLLEDFKRVYDELGCIPTHGDIDENSKYSMSTFQRRIGSIETILKRSGIDDDLHRKGVQYSQEEILSEVERVIQELGELPTIGEIETESYVSKSTIRIKFGGISKVFEKLGYEPKIRTYSPGKEKLIQEIQKISEEVCDGDTPSQLLLKDYSIYAKHWYIKEFGSWTEAVEAAGLEANDKVGEWDEVPTGKDHWNWKGGCEVYYGSSWYKQKRKVRERDGTKCQVCCIDCEDLHSRKPHIHHIRPRRDWEVEEEHENMNDLNNLVSLCPSCHKNLEGKWKDTDPDEFIRKGREYLDVDFHQEKKESIFDF